MIHDGLEFWPSQLRRKCMQRKKFVYSEKLRMFKFAILGGQNLNSSQTTKLERNESMRRIAGVAGIVALLLASSFATRTQLSMPAEKDRRSQNPTNVGAGSAAITPAVASGKTTAASTLVAVVVKIPIPPKIDCARLESGMAKTVPEFQALPGLVRKYYTVSDDQKFGGIYLWASRQAAEAHFNGDWRAKMARLYGSPPEAVYFAVPIVIEGPASQK
jgi:hypothetical protein